MADSISCDPQDLATAASCFDCIPRGQREAVKTYLLAQIYGGTMDPNVLSQLASDAGFRSLDGQQQAVQNYLLCQIVNK